MKFALVSPELLESSKVPGAAVVIVVSAALGFGSELEELEELDEDPIPLEVVPWPETGAVGPQEARVAASMTKQLFLTYSMITNEQMCVEDRAWHRISWVAVLAGPIITCEGLVTLGQENREISDRNPGREEPCRP